MGYIIFNGRILALAVDRTPLICFQTQNHDNIVDKVEFSIWVIAICFILLKILCANYYHIHLIIYSIPLCFL